jgi:hypothetical protein
VLAGIPDPSQFPGDDWGEGGQGLLAGGLEAAGAVRRVVGRRADRAACLEAAGLKGADRRSEVGAGDVFEVQDRWRQRNHSMPLGHSELAIESQHILGDPLTG